MARSEDGAQTLYAQISDIVGFERDEDESVENFKGRVVEEFSNMTQWPDEKYDALPQNVKDWAYDATTEYKANRTRKNKRKLPAMTGLDARERHGRADLNAPTRQAKQPKRIPGNDCVTRVMRELYANPAITLADLQTLLAEKYEKTYSKAAIRYGMLAYSSARSILRPDLVPQEEQQPEEATTTSTAPAAAAE